MNMRGSGVLLHITSLPSMYGIGDLGPAAYRFADFLFESRQRYWQILPLNPTDPAHDDNPYHSISAFASNPLLISPEQMVQDGYLDESDTRISEPFRDSPADFSRIIQFRERLFTLAWERFRKESERREFDIFCRQNAWWLDDFSAFLAIRTDRNGQVWNRWPEELRRHDPEAVMREQERLHGEIDRIRFLQFVFLQQWHDLHAYCRQRGIRIIGDLPIYVDYDSVDVWSHPGLFKLDSDLMPTVVAGVPPDYFSATGQLWYNPVYRWDELQKTGFSWWLQRMERNLSLADYVRIDHFRGLVACWEVPAGSRTAMDGKWVEAPAAGLLSALKKRFPCLPVIAEDLGVITPDVREVMRQFRIPGMKVLLFAFEDGFPESPYLPHNVIRDCILYTGTHDNNPVRGWIEGEATPAHRDRIRRYLGTEVPDNELSRAFIRLAMASVADTVIIPVQDLLNLGAMSRMNRPGTDTGNWKWRLSQGMITGELAGYLRDLTITYARD